MERFGYTILRIIAIVLSIIGILFELFFVVVSLMYVYETVGLGVIYFIIPVFIPGIANLFATLWLMAEGMSLTFSFLFAIVIPLSIICLSSFLSKETDKYFKIEHKNTNAIGLSKLREYNVIEKPKKEWKKQPVRRNNSGTLVWTRSDYAKSNKRIPLKENVIIKNYVCSDFENIYSQEIEDILNERGIKYLIHFTDIRNLESILYQGLWNIHSLQSNKCKYYHTDNTRLDGNMCVNLSVECPNYKYFDYIRNKTNNIYCVIRLDAKKVLLSTANYKFFTYTNSTNKVFAGRLNHYSKPSCFEDLFKGHGEKRPSKMDKSLPTDVQAEVLYYGCVPNNCIESVYFETEKDFNYFKSIMKNENDLYTFPVDIKISDKGGKYFEYSRNDFISRLNYNKEQYKEFKKKLDIVMRDFNEHKKGE